MIHSQLPAPVFLLTTLVLSFCLQAPESIHGAAAVSISKTINVNVNGGGDFSSIQKAIDSVPDRNNQWIRIHVAAGVYREKVNIGHLKSYIFLEGEGVPQTSIEWGDYNGDPAGHTTATGATFTSYAANFVAARIAFKNTFASQGYHTSQAVAALVAGDMSAFYECSFMGVQDTLFDYFGRHYFKGCNIQGATDFIFGRARSIYEACTISTVSIGGGFGFITAHGRNSSNDPGGFVFKGCTITGDQKVYLGRAWTPYARVIFHGTSMPNIIDPKGWDAWNAVGKEKNIMFAESGCSGPGSDVSSRVNWESKLSDVELKSFVDMSFIDTDGWINAQPSSTTKVN